MQSDALTTGSRPRGADACSPVAPVSTVPPSCRGRTPRCDRRHLTRRRFGACGRLLVALALAVLPSAAGASRPAAPELPGFGRTNSVEAQAARRVVAHLERDLARELAAVSGPTVPSATSTGERSAVLSPARAFYGQLLNAPIEVAPSARAGPAGAGADVATAAASRQGGALLGRAQSYRGTPYVWGGASGEGLDCSGLVVRTARDLGQSLPHSAAELYRLGEPVADSQLQPGDLVFFRDTYKPGISHVGIFSGGTRFLQASSRAGRVTDGDLARPYYRRKYAGARRLSLGGRAAQTARRWLSSAGRVLAAPFRLGAP